ncbi:helix-turn-helix domain-containing protein [Providencia vermicola]|uniref:helix-turn-helix domain-containing protein n=1 Tax=Providencia vermicola TaxID=333965 RepID=UPI00352317B8
MMKTHNELHNEWMKNPEYRAAYEEELQKEKLQALLTEWRTNAGLTKAELAKKLGVNPSTVTRMESNVDNASIRNIIKYAAACGIRNPIISL